jgi:hypothetical protein
LQTSDKLKFALSFDLNRRAFASVEVIAPPSGALLSAAPEWLRDKLNKADSPPCRRPKPWQSHIANTRPDTDAVVVFLLAPCFLGLTFLLVAAITLTRRHLSPGVFANVLGQRTADVNAFFETALIVTAHKPLVGASVDQLPLRGSFLIWHYVLLFLTRSKTDREQFRFVLDRSRQPLVPCRFRETANSAPEFSFVSISFRVSFVLKEGRSTKSQ